jgi:hypothetical protein
VDYRVFHTVNVFASHHTWLAHATHDFETLGVVLYAGAVLLLWLATVPGEDRRWKCAALCGGASGGVALLVNQVIARIWHRPRPYQTHAHVYHLTNSRDPSFPSDHASAAFGIAFGIYFFDRRVGRFFLIVAGLIAAGRVLIGAHYVTDVVASFAIALIAAAFVARFGRRLLYCATLLLEMATDPLVRAVHKADGSGRRQLVSGKGEFLPKVSPDGHRILFARGRWLYAMRSDGTYQRRLAQTSVGYYRKFCCLLWALNIAWAGK